MKTQKAQGARHSPSIPRHKFSLLHTGPSCTSNNSQPCVNEMQRGASLSLVIHDCLITYISLDQARTRLENLQSSKHTFILETGLVGENLLPKL